MTPHFFLQPVIVVAAFVLPMLAYSFTHAPSAVKDAVSQQNTRPNPAEALGANAFATPQTTMPNWLIRSAEMKNPAALLIGQASPQALPAASAPKPAPHVEPRQDTFDFEVPVLTMEQVYSGQTRLQGYRIQLFKDGRVLYHGLKNVKTLGEERFNIKPEQGKRPANPC